MARLSMSKKIGDNMGQQQLVNNTEKLIKVLSALKVMVDKPMQEDRSNVDATIQRFEFTIELFWKSLKYLLVEKGVDVRYPKEILQAAYAGGLIDQESAWILMLHDRNLTSHTYNEDLADEIYQRIIRQHYPLLEATISRLFS